MRDCVFCRIVTGQEPAQRVYEDDLTLVFMDINPATEGHCLVIPKAHVEDVWALEQPHADAVWHTTLRAAHGIRDGLHPLGLNLVQANGRAGFQHVWHFHIHVIPRYRDDRVSRPWVLRRGSPVRIATAAGRIRSALV